LTDLRDQSPTSLRRGLAGVAQDNRAAGVGHFLWSNGNQIGKEDLMLHLNPDGLAITRLSPSALGAVELLHVTDGLYVESGSVQVMIFHERIGQLGGLSTVPRGQYILASAVVGRITAERLQELGFLYATRNDGSHYWYRPGHMDFRGLFTALGEMTGLAI
jgi:hypothetical protein